MSTRNWILACLGMVLMIPMTAMAQRQGGPGGGGPGGGGPGGFGGGNFDPAQFRQMQLQNIQEQLGANEQEWKVISPKIEAVMTAQQDANSGRGRGGFGGRGGGRGGPGGGGPGGPGGGAATTPVAKAMQDLQTTLENSASTADQIAAKVTALRDARTKATATLTASQKALREVLTARQEAVLITMGYLD